MLVKAVMGDALPAKALARSGQASKEIFRNARYTLDLGTANPLKRRTEAKHLLSSDRPVGGVVCSYRTH